MPIRVGFIVGKDTDVVEDPKYAALGGDVSFLADFPDKYRVDPVSHEYLMDCDPGTVGHAHADVAIAWWVKKHFGDIEVDLIAPVDITLKRLKSNAINFIMGYNAVSVAIENNCEAPRMLKAFRKCGNTVPTLELEDFISQKSRYMRACMDAGVPMAPTIFAPKGKRSPASLLHQITQRGWKHFVMKQSESGFSLGFVKLSVESCQRDPSILKTYFKDYASCPEYVVQEAIDGFTRNWETRCFWYNGEFLYAIANMAAVSVSDGAERIITGDDIPKEFLENAKRIGREAIKALPPLKAPTGQTVPMVLVRTDIGCSDSPIYDRNTHWNPNQKTFFLNEIEPSSTTYFVRHLKFDCLPLYGKLYGDTARLIHEEMQKGPVKGSRSRLGTRVLKKPAVVSPVVPAKRGRLPLMKRVGKVVKTKGTKAT
eukprot:CAMPEP_0194483738 /NCGR_PEP_ID=MMETSP0253-20130528/5254_1 /TAXON_ID=2966 /ORGANISM="Noctiluca scintillans" /LENGTH=425 /DNA_ID=CAMNT_0039323423 /DNA_START=59 /DNA_END=1336 /DNA_ORIENTATION=-